MKTLHITIADKIATYLQRDGAIVCGNSDYQIVFAFDAEWDEFSEKTARFIWDGKYYDQKFTDNICPVPIISDAENVSVGVYAGELSTTTPASIPCKRSILCDTSIITDGKVKEYRDEVILYAERAVESATEAAASAQQTKDIAESIDIPLIVPHSVSYGTNSIEGIIEDTDSLPLAAFSRTPKADDIFFFIAKTKKNDVVGVTAKVLGIADDNKWVQFHVEDATLFHSATEIADIQKAVDELKTEEWTFIVENEDGSTTPVTKKVYVQ